MRHLRILGALAVLGLAAWPAAAFSNKLASRSTRQAVLTAIVHQRQLRRAQANCQVVTVSTVNPAFAASSWPRHLSRSCLRVAANGVIIEHYTRRAWRFVSVGSDFRCPIRGVPMPVARDLRVCS